MWISCYTKSIKGADNVTADLRSDCHKIATYVQQQFGSCRTVPGMLQTKSIISLIYIQYLYRRGPHRLTPQCTWVETISDHQKKHLITFYGHLVLDLDDRLRPHSQHGLTSSRSRGYTSMEDQILATVHKTLPTAGCDNMSQPQLLLQQVVVVINNNVPS